MPIDAVMLGFAAREIDALLEGGRVQKITQPERDELVLAVRSRGGNHSLLLTANAASPRAGLIAQKRANPLEPSSFLMLLRKKLSAARFLSARLVGGDRILEFELETMDELGDIVRRVLVLECMGKYSNLMLLTNGKILDSARHVTEEISRVREVLPGLAYERPPQDRLPFDALDEDALRDALSGAVGESVWKAISSKVSGLSKQTAREVAARFCEDADMRLREGDVARLAQFVACFMRSLPSLLGPRVVTDASGALLDVTPFPYLQYADLPQTAYDTVSEALEAFYDGRDRMDRVKQKSSALRRSLKNNIERCEKKLALQREAQKDGERMEEYRINGELLTAHLGEIARGAKSVSLPNYYSEDGGEIEIALDVKLAPAQNAQRYFKLYQKAKSAARLAREQIEKTTAELVYLEGQLDNLDKCGGEDELNEIREELAREGYVRDTRSRRQIKSLPPSLPLKFTSPDGTIILVGKNNLQNDKITGEARPEEVWLHVKDIPGSHTLIISENPSDETILFAASLAARYSKASTSPRVSVDYTRRKHVKKPAGAKPGFVIYTHQKTLLVEPFRG